MSNSIWWFTSDYYGRTSRELPTYYLRLGVRGTWLHDHDWELWQGFVTELERRSSAPGALARGTNRPDNGHIPPY